MPKYEVSDWVDIHLIQQATLTFARSIGFARRECGELAIVASELTSNILKYGVRGSIQLDLLCDERGSGIVIIAEDCGPPFRDLSAAMRDGHDDRGPIDPLSLLTRQGIGAGLGAVLRFTHTFDVQGHAAGKSVRVVRYVQSTTPGRRGSVA